MLGQVSPPPQLCDVVYLWQLVDGGLASWAPHLALMHLHLHLSSLVYNLGFEL